MIRVTQGWQGLMADAAPLMSSVMFERDHHEVPKKERQQATFRVPSRSMSGPATVSSVPLLRCKIIERSEQTRIRFRVAHRKVAFLIPLLPESKIVRTLHAVA
jgi:hypothetical protein